MNNSVMSDVRRRWLSLALPAVLVLSVTCLFGCVRANQVSKEEQEVRAFLEEVAEDEIKRDPAVFDRLAAPEFIRIGADGEVWNKEQTLAFARKSEPSGKWQLERHNEQIRIYGDTAVVTTLGIVRGRDQKGAYEMRNLCTIVLVKRDGRWQCVSVQQTRQA